MKHAKNNTGQAGEHARAVMKRHKDKGRIQGQFVPLLVETMKSDAWRAMSPYARVVYIALKSRYSSRDHNNGRIYISTRDGMELTGFDKKTVGRALRELQHYGFIVMTEPGCLGLEGRGKAPHWRLTELGHMREPPTREFLKWDGTIFQEQKSPKHYACKKQNPVPPDGPDCTAERYIPVVRRTDQLAVKVVRQTVHTDEAPCTVQRDISRVNHSPALNSPPLSPSSAADLGSMLVTEDALSSLWSGAKH